MEQIERVAVDSEHRVHAVELTDGTVNEVGKDYERLLSNDQRLYLVQLCGMTGREYTSLPFDKFAQLTDKKEVNKLFFSLAPQETQAVHPSQRKALEEFLVNNFQNSTVASRYKSALADYTYCTERLKKSTAQFIEISRTYRALQTVNSATFREIVEQINAEKKWKLTSIDTAARKITFTMVNDCILTHSRPEQGVSITANLGKMSATINFGKEEVIVKGPRNRRGYCHPHISSWGDVCWGNAQEMFKEAMVNYNIKNILHALYLLLHEYNEDSVYIGIHEFMEFEGYTNIGEQAFWYDDFTSEERKKFAWDELDNEERYITNDDGEEYEETEGVLGATVYMKKGTQEAFVRSYQGEWIRVYEENTTRGEWNEDKN